MNKKPHIVLMIFLLHAIITAPASIAQKQQVTFQSLLREMSDSETITRWPAIGYKSLQSSSYNRASVASDKPGWFADSDGVSWIREEMNNGLREYVIMEHYGPGCITRIWTPFFYYAFDNRKGPDIKIYLDGNREPVINENFIALVTGKGSVKPPFANYTARAGVAVLPIPFSKSCKVTLNEKAFYNIINYRAYEKGSAVETFTKELASAQPVWPRIFAEDSKIHGTREVEGHKPLPKTILADDSLVVQLPEGPHAVSSLSVQFNPLTDNEHLRSTILKIDFDGNQTVWCPVGDFFCSPDTINPFTTRNLSVTKEGMMRCNWIMPYASKGLLTILNTDNKPITVTIDLKVREYLWDERSMYFHTNMTNIGPLPGDRFFDLNFVDIKGKGVLVGDALTVLSPGNGWWGEGDEKIYIDENDIDRKFPSHFGTGTEDYYGWAGGVVPTGKDLFSMPFGANVRIGNQQNPSGYNICLRNRILDDIPFKNRLIFDMEASPGTDIREYWNLLAYSMVTYWYGMPGAKPNRLRPSDSAGLKLMTLSEIKRIEQLLKDSTLLFNPARVDRKVRGTETKVY